MTSSIAVAALACSTTAALAGIEAQLVFSRSFSDNFNLVAADRYAIGDGGHVAFAVSEDLIGSRHSLRLWQAGSQITLTAGAERITSLGVDGAGRVAYASARLQAGVVAESFVRVADTGGLTEVTSLPGSAGSFNNNFSVRSLNAAGQLAVSRTGGGSSIFNIDAGIAPSVFAESLTVEPGFFNNLSGAFVLDNGSAFVQAARPAQAASRVYGWNAQTGSLTAVINTLDPTSAIVNIDGAFAASGGGNVAVIGAARGAAGERVVLFDGASTLVLNVAEGDTALTNLGRISVNDSGTVLFTAVSPGTFELTIYAWRNGQTTRLLGVGDTLFGSSLLELDISNQALNDAGEFAFYFRLADGRTGYALALVPAPAGLAIPAAAMGFALRRRRVR